MTTPENRAHQVVETYVRDAASAGSDIVPVQTRLQILITEAIHKALIADHEALRERMPCASGDPCGFEMCAHHKALIAAVMATQDGAPPPPRSLFSKPLNG
jgi:hypothetical protein